MIKLSLILASILILSSCNEREMPNQVASSLDDGYLNAAHIIVIDGDTVRFSDEKIRLNGIDSPESNQKGGKEATAYLKKLLSETASVKLKSHKKDRYGRTIADLYNKKQESICLLMVKAGHAWHYKKYSDDKELAAAEVYARKNKLGLWQEANPTPPWEFRKLRRN